MAYTYDEFGNVSEYESEEERRRRLALEQPVKQTITYNPDGTQEMTIKGTPEALSPANPNTPTVSAPVAPDQTYGRMLQVESGNRDFDRQGRPITSPKGAMFAAQVMPATARQPGYGIRPAAAQTPEEYNRVGQEYFQAMRRQFPGNEAAAIAAYNAGPGRVQQNMRQNQGQLNPAQLPRETQGYLQKVGNMVGNLFPSAQAGTLPPQAQQARPSQAQAQLAQQQPQAAQQPLPDSVINDQVAAFERRQPYSLATGQSGLGLQAPQAAAPAQPAADTGLFDFYQRNQDNPQALISMGFSDAPGMPDFLKDRMKNRAAELIQQQREEAAARQQIPNMTESDIARALREKTTGGSYIKAALFGMLGMEQSAAAEAAKLGIGKEILTTINNQPALVKVAANGTPIEGYNAATGQKLKAEELVIAAQSGTAQRGVEVEAGTYQDPTGAIPGNWMLERKAGGGSQFRQVGTGKIATEEQANALRKTGVGGTLADQRARQIQEINLKLQGKGVEEQMRILGDYNKQLAGAGFPIVQPSEVGIRVPQIGGGAPTTGAVAPTAAPSQAQAAAGQAQAAPSQAQAAAGARPSGAAPVAPVAPVAPTAVGAPAAGPRPTAPQLAAQAEALKQEAEEVGTDLGKVRTNYGKSKDAATRLINQAEDLITDPGFSVSVGASVQPFFQYIPGTDRATWKAKHDEVVGQTFLAAIENLKGLGALSDREGAAATAAISRLKDTNQNEESFKAAVKELQFIVKRGVDRNAEKLGREKPFGTSEPEVGATAMSPADKARAELEKRKKEKKN